MIKFTAPAKDGKMLIGLGITSENLGRLAAGQPIVVKCEELTVKDAEGHDTKFPYPIEILIMYGRTEADITEALAPLIGPETTKRKG